MLSAKKSYTFEKLFGAYNKNLLRRNFNKIHVSGLRNLANKTTEFPVILYINHSSWWDGLVSFELSRKLKLDSFFLMEEKHLKRLSIFRRLGAFSVVREKPREAVESINYAVQTLSDKPNRALWIFPQGEILPNDTRPFIFYSGISRIAQKLKQVQIASIALRFEFLDVHKPDVFIKIGALQNYSIDKNFDIKKETQIFAASLARELDELKSNIINKSFVDFESLI